MAMNKRFLCGALLLSLVTPVYAGLYFAPVALYQQISAKHLVFEGISPRWSLGYDTVFSGDFYFGFELYADYPIANIKTSRSVHTLPNIRPKYSWGGSILPGMVFDDYVDGFLRLGAAVTNFSQWDRTLKGYQVGIGMDYRLSTSTKLRGEYDFVGYQVLDGVGQPHANQASVGLVYNFDCWDTECNS